MYIATVIKVSLLLAAVFVPGSTHILMDNDVFSMTIKETAGTVHDKICTVPNDNARFNCLPENYKVENSSTVCEARGCCWEHHDVPQSESDSPSCYFPESYNGYTLSDLKETSTGFTASLIRTSASGWPNDITHLTLDILMETQSRLRFKIYDANNQRFEVPLDTPKVTKKADVTDYTVKLTPKPFGITVHRKSTGALLFDSALVTAPLVFSDQFIQISTHTGTGLVYGLGEHKSHLLHPTNRTRLVMWARDKSPQLNTDLYGTHPFYLSPESDGQAHGVVLLNSNAMEVDIQPLPALTFRTIGGILDFYVFTGPSSDKVIEQYTDVIGKPFMPPYWALGFHLCRYGYRSSYRLKQIIARNRKIKIPYEVQWTDIDYMSGLKDWTYDKIMFRGLPKIVKNLHDEGQKYIPIVDPGISSSHKGHYAPYDQGITQDIFIKNATGKTLIGKVWPGAVAFPDFFHPKAADWWYDQASEFHKVLPFDGVWIDMNEPSNFADGSSLGCTNNTEDNPPYVPAVSGVNLHDGSVCPSAKQHLSTHYNLHNMYGYSETVATYRAAIKVLEQRSIVISRSTFIGSGHHGGHWSGDITSSWEDLFYSIPVMLNFQMYGVPMVGADICGFGGNTTEELCTRWMQLGAFYPFMRNHNTYGASDQDPGAFSSKAQKIMREALELRYSLLPYLYTTVQHSHMFGTSVVKPLFFEFPKERDTYGIDHQFLSGRSLLISPALEEKQTKVKAYFPRGKWYEIIEGVPLVSNGEYETLDAPIEKINVHIRGGSIIPIQEPAVTTNISRTMPFSLDIALNASGQAFGMLFWDDGETIDSYDKGVYTSMIFVANQDQMQSTIEHSGYKPASGMSITSIRVLGVKTTPKAVKINGKSAEMIYHGDKQLLLIDDFTANLLLPLNVQWG